MKFDSLIKGGTLVLPGHGPVRADVGCADGRVSAIASDLSTASASEIVDARGLHVFPGAVDSHFHVGIYRPHAEDARSESLSAVSGGVTTLISYFRTGQHYLNKTGAYRDIFPEVLGLSAGNFHTDYGYHIAPMTTAQLDEIPWLVEQGVSSFKYYMFYKALTLSADSTRGKDYTMADEYDLGHMYEIMVRVAEARKKTGRRISLSLHCENPEIIRVFIQRVKKAGLTGLQAYSEARPSLSERLSIQEAGVLADETSCPVNLLHLSSRKAIEAGVDVRTRHPDMDITLETTLHHLALTWETAGDLKSKVNPPIRTQDDQDALWRALIKGDVDTVVSDHACCMEENKKGDTWTALPGFGGSALLYPVLLSEGVHKRGLPLERVVDLISATPARRFGLYPKKGAIAVGSDADFAIIDLNKEQAVTVANAHSAQDHNPFAGKVLKGWPVETVLRGHLAFKDGSAVGERRGAFIARPV
jgi:dihydropyrimidinase/allantoinase